VAVLSEPAVRSGGPPRIELRILCFRHEGHDGRDAIPLDEGRRKGRAPVIQLIFFLAIGLGLFVALYFLMRPAASAQGSADELRNARLALNALQTGLLSGEVVHRIFAKEDLEYISEGPVEIRDMFLAERRRLALFWVAQMRLQILNLRKFHLGSARFHAGLKMRTEVRLAAEFLFLLFTCRLLWLALYLRGVYAAPAMVERATATAERVCAISETSLGFLNRSMDSLRNESVRNPTLS